MSTSNHSSGNQSYKYVVLAGPTASGKTALALRIASIYRSGIICADSRTVISGLDIGTAKPTPDEQARVPHYGLDLVSPGQRYSAAQFHKSAKNWIRELSDDGRLPLVVGGTGLYIDGLVYDYRFGPAADADKRKKLEKLSIQELQDVLKSSGLNLPTNHQNRRHLIRYIERGSAQVGKIPIPASVLYIGLWPEDTVIKDRIHKRALAMIEDGVLDEARLLYKTQGEKVASESGNIYRALLPYLRGESSVETCLADFCRMDWQLVRRQRTWFKRNKDIQWFPGGEEAYNFLTIQLAKQR